MSAIIKVDDTTVGIEAGRNAGTWTVGVSKSGNLVGLSQDEMAKLTTSEVNARIEATTEKLMTAGAHYAIESVAEITSVIEDVEERISQGEQP